MTSVCDHQRWHGTLASICAGLILSASWISCPQDANGRGIPWSLSSAIAMQRPNDAPVSNACGTVFLRMTPTSQEFTVTVRNIPSEVPTDGLGVFLSDAPGDTNNMYFVNVLDGPGTNGTWRLSLKSSLSASPQLNVPDVTNLTERIIYIADATTNVYLKSIIPPFVSSVSNLSYNIRVRLGRPDPAPSPKATGVLHVKLNGRKGSSLMETRVRDLMAGNSYCCWIRSQPGTPTESDCPKTPNLVGGSTVFRSDTGKGDQLAENALDQGHVRIDQYSGLTVEIRDQFGEIHLQGIIP